MPKVPRTPYIWDPNIVLEFLRKKSPCRSLNLKDLSYKTYMLMLLTTGQRGQTILACRIDEMEIKLHKIIFNMNTLLKTSTPHHHFTNLSLKAYPPDRRICPVTYIKEYIHRTKRIRQSQQLFIQLNPPHEAISRDTLRRWTKNTMHLAGIDTKKFNPHSTRAASTSKAAAKGVSLDIIY